jgi:hypothetical protein
LKALQTAAYCILDSGVLDAKSWRRVDSPPRVKRAQLHRPRRRVITVHADCSSCQTPELDGVDAEDGLPHTCTPQVYIIGPTRMTLSTRALVVVGALALALAQAVTPNLRGWKDDDHPMYEACHADCASLHRTTVSCEPLANGSTTSWCGACLPGFYGNNSAPTVPCAGEYYTRHGGIRHADYRMGKRATRIPSDRLIKIFRWWDYDSERDVLGCRQLWRLWRRRQL